MTLPITVAPALADSLHNEIRNLTDYLGVVAAAHGHVALLRAGLTVTLRAARDLDRAVLPPASVPLPGDAELGWPDPDADVAGRPPIFGLSHADARSIVVASTDHSQELNARLAAIQKELPRRRAPRELVMLFAYLMGYLYTEVCRPLHLEFPDLEPLAMGDEDVPPG